MLTSIKASRCAPRWNHGSTYDPIGRFISRRRYSQIIFSGIQPTGVPHLGNYLGALRQWVRLQDSAETSTKLLYSLVDLHAITIRQDPAQLRQWKEESLAILLAIGLNPERSIIYHQGDVSSHAELMWILSCQASTGYLGRMTQWKEKTGNGRENSERLKLGLFSYPVLQAADVLLYQTTHVPVGHDQAQHLEFARELAIGFNSVYGNGEQILTAPETIISPARRIMSLTEPTSKMSKSHANAKSRILLTDTSQVISAKLKAAITDSVNGITYDPEARPGVSNLIDILYHARHDRDDITKAELAKEFEGRSLRMLKEEVATAIEQVVGPIRERYESIVANKSALRDIAQSGAQKAAEAARPTLLRVRQAVGLS
ncbi:hypothetical protein AMS68_004673 [Peltaster fructicola]|uniref:Tryptophan--tRNA ligase, mitochondrial n=1 Tax=Peltaster fructicola TaxID=286661 RepID=A0A6H0XWU7_9PEZI|nr:hypothetical protein AMS68_004673 [Peltaster fructicola]